MAHSLVPPPFQPPPTHATILLPPQSLSLTCSMYAHLSPNDLSAIVVVDVDPVILHGQALDLVVQLLASGGEALWFISQTL